MNNRQPAYQIESLVDKLTMASAAQKDASALRSSHCEGCIFRDLCGEKSPAVTMQAARALRSGMTN